MTTPLVLAPFLPPSDAVSVHPRLDIDGADCTLTRNVVRVALTALGPTPPGPVLASDGDASKGHTHRAASPWTGTPLRAIVPLPRRTLASVNGSGNILAARPPLSCVAAGAHRNDAGEETDSEDEHARADSVKDGDGRDGDHDVPSGPRYCSYESITATEGLASYSFEELRAECYAQSLIARGTRPPPVVQPSLAIPPAFIPRIVLRY